MEKNYAHIYPVLIMGANNARYFLSLYVSLVPHRKKWLVWWWDHFYSPMRASLWRGNGKLSCSLSLSKEVCHGWIILHVQIYSLKWNYSWQNGWTIILVKIFLVELNFLKSWQKMYWIWMKDNLSICIYKRKWC